MTGFGPLDPRTKLFLVLAISSLAVFVKNIYILLFVFVLSCAAVTVTGISMWNLLKKTKRFFMIFVAIVIIQSVFTQGGQALIRVMDVTLLSDLGLTRGTQTILRFLIVISSASIMTTSKYREIIQGLVQIKIPYEIAFMVTVAIRFLPILRDEVRDIMTAIQLRGINLKQIPLMKRFKTYSYLLLPMISSVLVKSQELSVAMEMRAFRAYPKRSSFRILQFRQADYYVMALCAVLSLAIVVLTVNVK